MLGIGAFATVYAAHDPTLDIEVAIKLLGEPAAHDPDLRRRFIDEARTLRRLTDVHVVRVHDLGEHEGRPYLVMDVHEVGTLGDRLDALTDDTVVSDEELRRVVAGVEACLAAVHREGLVHRDVKPSNLLVAATAGAEEGSAARLLGDTEQLVLADFGLVRRADATDLTIAAGTDAYMAPEQREVGAAVDSRADLYAATRLVADLVERHATPATENRLASVLASGAAADPADRPGSAAAWASSLQAAITGDRPTAVPAADRRRRRTTIAVGVAALVIVLVAVLALVSARTSDGPGDDVSTTVTGPQIIGPDELLLGDEGSWTHENRPGLSYAWTLPTGESSDDLVVTYTPTDSAEFELRLVETDGATQRDARLVVRVRTR